MDVKHKHTHCLVSTCLILGTSNLLHLACPSQYSQHDILNLPSTSVSQPLSIPAQHPNLPPGESSSWPFHLKSHMDGWLFSLQRKVNTPLFSSVSASSQKVLPIFPLSNWPMVRDQEPIGEQNFTVRTIPTSQSKHQ